MRQIQFDNITAGYGTTKVIEDISFEIHAKELVGILGVNGCGKSTLAKAICNILPHEGEVHIDGKIVEKLSTKEIANLISYVPQHSGIEIDISVLDVVMMGFNSKLKLFEQPSKAMVEQAKKVLEHVGLSDKANMNYRLLSEGQKQLVILARALVSDGDFLVLDEPESALDFNVRYMVMDILRSFVQQEERAAMVILHDTMLALNCCDRIFLLQDKKIVGIIDIANDTIDAIEKNLRKVYGNINVVKTRSKNGKEGLVMICDSEDI